MILWYRDPSDVGYSRDDLSRFEVIGGLSFGSVLDIGSGPCLLHRWLKSLDIEVRYEAYDTRSDALSLCDCIAHSTLPSGVKYDLVCLFGVCDYSRPADAEMRKAQFAELLADACSLSSRYIVFTMTKDFSVSKILGYRSSGSTIPHRVCDVFALASSLPIQWCVVKDTPDGVEYSAVCRVR